jgi:hypothetical protein
VLVVGRVFCAGVSMRLSLVPVIVFVIVIVVVVDVPVPVSVLRSVGMFVLVLVFHIHQCTLSTASGLRGDFHCDELQFAPRDDPMRRVPAVGTDDSRAWDRRAFGLAMFTENNERDILDAQLASLGDRFHGRDFPRELQGVRSDAAERTDADDDRLDAIDALRECSFLNAL